MEFASSFYTVQSTTADVDKALTSCFATGKQENFVFLRRLLFNQRNRDHAINKILSYLQAKEFTVARVQNVFAALRQCLLSPAPSDLGYMDALTSLLIAVHGDDSLNAECAAAVHLLDQFRMTHEALGAWKGRLALHDVPFPEVFFSRVSQPQVTRRARKRETQAKSTLRAGVYVGLVCVTPSRSILLDKDGNLPVAFVCDESAAPRELMESDTDGPDFVRSLACPVAWLTSAFDVAVVVGLEF